MLSKLFRVLKVLTCAVLIAQLTGCGTIMYPERRGQRGGRIDPGVAVLDGLGLLLFVIPGIIAFAIDFGTGTIYLPGGRRRHRSSTDMENLKIVKFDPIHCTNETLEKIVKQETGFDVKFSQAIITRLRSRDEMKPNLAKAFSVDKK